jgi:hypothetical protein
VGNTQRLIDSRNKLRVDTSFVNLNDGKDWGARVEMNGEEKTRMTGIWYISLEGDGRIRLVEQEDEQNVSRFVCTAWWSRADGSNLLLQGLVSPIVLLGNTPDLGSFRIVLTERLSSPSDTPRPPSLISSFFFLPDDDSRPITTGRHANNFASTHNRVSFTGVAAPPEDLWRAKGECRNSFSASSSGFPLTTILPF